MVSNIDDIPTGMVEYYKWNVKKVNLMMALQKHGILMIKWQFHQKLQREAEAWKTDDKIIIPPQSLSGRYLTAAWSRSENNHCKKNRKAYKKTNNKLTK